MSVKIRISYQTPGELERILKLLGPEIKKLKSAKREEGRFKKAYVELKNCRKENGE